AARTPAEVEDARRALELARGNQVHAPLPAPEDGVVVSVSANAGERIAQGDEVAAIAELASLAFVADIPQADAAHIRAGEDAGIRLVGREGWIAGVVQAVLPPDSSAAMTVHVRIALRPGSIGPSMPVNLRLFGTAEIEVGRATDVPVVPRAA